jgi:integrase/recombinase XerC
LSITTALDRTNGDVRTVQRFSRHRKLDVLLVYDDRRRDQAGRVAELVAGDD